MYISILIWYVFTHHTDSVMLSILNKLATLQVRK